MGAQTLAGQPSRARGTLAPPGPDPRPAPRRALLGSPTLIAIAACVAIGAASAALLPTVPSYDPWAWIVWGREVVDPHLPFAVGGGSSWKPLPVIFTAVLALFGGGAPTLWVILSRAGGLLGLLAGYRLAARLVGGGRWGAVAGLVAAAGIVLTQRWGYFMFRGTSEPLLIGASLWAIDRHLARRHGSAFVLGVATGLIRPEAWPLIAVYACWLWVARPRLRPLVLAGLGAIPVFWFVPPWIASGQPFLAAIHAHDYNGHLGADPFVEVLRRGANLQVAPALVLGFVGAVLLARDRTRRAPWLAGLAIAWWVIVVVMTLAGYPGLERFYLPAAAVTCVLAGAGVVSLSRLIGDALRASWLAVAVAAVLIAASAPFTAARVTALRAQQPLATRAVTRLDQLTAAVAAVGGHSGVYPCGSSFAGVNHAVQTALAWKLAVTLGRVGTSMRHQGVMFVGPHDTIDGQAPRIARSLTHRELIARAGAWRVYRMTAPGADTRCVGR
jgi:hypothetical protein